MQADADARSMTHQAPNPPLLQLLKGCLRCLILHMQALAAAGAGGSQQVLLGAQLHPHLTVRAHLAAHQAVQLRRWAEQGGRRVTRATRQQVAAAGHPCQPKPGHATPATPARAQLLQPQGSGAARRLPTSSRISTRMLRAARR